MFAGQPERFGLAAIKAGEQGTEGFLDPAAVERYGKDQRPGGGAPAFADFRLRYGSGQVALVELDDQRQVPNVAQAKPVG